MWLPHNESRLSSLHAAMCYSLGTDSLLIRPTTRRRPRTLWRDESYSCCFAETKSCTPSSTLVASLCAHIRPRLCNRELQESECTRRIFLDMFAGSWTQAHRNRCVAPVRFECRLSTSQTGRTGCPTAHGTFVSAIQGFLWPRGILPSLTQML